MLRPIPSVLALLAAMLITAPAIAADIDNNWSGDGSDSGGLRDGYPTEPGDWAGLGDKDDPIHIETGLRYWYSMGAQSFSSGGSTLTSNDTGHIAELHLRIEDHSTNTYAKAIAGYSFKIDGTSSAGTIADGTIGYLGADIGWNVLGDNNGSGVGLFGGYMYWNDSPDTGRFNYTTATSSADIPYDSVTGQTFLPGNSAPNNVNVNLLRLGVSGKANLGDWFDVSAEVAAVPYAKVSGSVGVDDPTFDPSVYGGAAQLPYSSHSGNIATIRSSPTAIDGWGYGAQAEAWLGIHPTENLAFRLGGRLWYLQGTEDATYSKAQIGNPSPSPGPYTTAPTYVNSGFISTNNPFSMMRYGLLAEMTYAF